MILTPMISYAQISGVVFQDIPSDSSTLNMYGVKDTNEKGIAGVKVTAYPDGISTTTDSNGYWELNTTGDTRVEFSSWPSYLEESSSSNNNSSVRFVPNGTSINFALYDPTEYVRSLSTNLITTLQTNGLNINNDNSVIKIVPPSSSTQDNSVGNIIDVAKAKEVGSVWGIAYDKSNKILYTSAMLRRHVSVGAKGLGAIYKVDLRDLNNPTVSHFTTIPDVGNDQMLLYPDRNLSSDFMEPSHDPVFNEVGRIGLGDIDIDEKKQKLFITNIKNNSLVEVDISNPSSQTSYPIGNPFSTCTDVKSWGIKVHQDKVYVGSVCTNNVTSGAAVSVLESNSITLLHT
ncbi:MAG TPA: hypothetical protein ENK91_15925, partial [Bacteroidetes bacterium]|nr:hypothetical protein [Bacteroidota bacterium]